MREAYFIKKNKEKWKEFESLIKESSSMALDRLSFLLTDVVDDLAYYQTYYPQSPTKSYLNKLTSKVFLMLHKNRTVSLRYFTYFWGVRVPQTIRNNYSIFIFTALVFLFFIVCGWLTNVINPDFTKVILGSSYVDMTLENIKNGNPTKVYQENDPWNMFIGIAYNNLKVELNAFVWGALLGIGTCYILMQNGIMIGVFFYLFYAHNVHEHAWRIIMIHGTIEISTIVISGAAGMIIGRSIFFPKTYTRYQSFTKGAKEAFTILIAVLPFTVLAAWLESYVTPHNDIPVGLNYTIILLSIILIVGYFGIYPIYFKRSIPQNY